MALVPLAIPFAVTEGAVLAAEGGGILGGLGSFITSVLSFTGAGAIINDVTKAFEGEPKKDAEKLTESKLDDMNPLVGPDKDKYKDIDQFLKKSPMFRK